MRVGLFGGSFDPVHRGHLEPVLQARTELDLERVIYLPTARPPHKTARSATALQRYAMVELALIGEEGLFASPFELRDETCYTVDTIEYFRNKMPEAELVLLIGADSFAAFTSWRQWQRILDTVELAVMVRPGWQSGELTPPFDDARRRGRIHFVPNEPWPVSSTDLRGRLERGEAISPETIPSLVLNYIRKYRLYQGVGSGRLTSELNCSPSAIP